MLFRRGSMIIIGPDDPAGIPAIGRVLAEVFPGL